MYNFRTDLADERREVYKKANNIENEIEGIETEEIEQNENIKISRVKITNQEGEKALGKPIGNYVTIYIEKLKIATEEQIDEAAKNVTQELKKIIDIHISNKEDILVVGLGNIYITPDSLGPKVVNEIEITRHLLNYTPQYLDENTRPVSAVAPGVLGTTGIETVEILKGIVEHIKPKLLIVIDSLASKSLERISSTIQIADTGIIPGGGVGNQRKEISKNTLGVPVIAIGVPMVVDLITISNEGIDDFIQNLQNNAKSTEYLNELKEKGEYFSEFEENNAQKKDFENMIVTPKEIDGLIENMKDVIARGINYAV